MCRGCGGAHAAPWVAETPDTHGRAQGGTAEAGWEWDRVGTLW